MSDYLLYDYLPALLETLAVELGVAVLLGFWNLRQLGVIALASLITHPLLHVALWWVVCYSDTTIPIEFSTAALEGIVFLSEAMMLRNWLHLPARTAFPISAAMNGASYLIGIAVQ